MEVKVVIIIPSKIIIKLHVCDALDFQGPVLSINQHSLFLNLAFCFLILQ